MQAGAGEPRRRHLLIGARLHVVADAPHHHGPVRAARLTQGLPLSLRSRLSNSPGWSPGPPGAKPHFLRKAKLPKQINQSVKSSLGERLSQLAQPRSSKGNCSRSPRRKQQIVLRSSSPAALLPNPRPLPWAVESTCALGISQGQHRLSFWLPGQCPAQGHCCGRRAQSHCLALVPVLPERPSLAPRVWWPLALGGSHGWRGALASKGPSGQTPYLSWRPGSDGDRGIEDKAPGSKEAQGTRPL